MPGELIVPRIRWERKMERLAGARVRRAMHVMPEFGIRLYAVRELAEVSRDHICVLEGQL